MNDPKAVKENTNNSANSSVHSSKLTHMPDTDSIAFRLRDLLKPDLTLWLFSWFLGLITAISVVGLLMASGSFLTATAFVGALSLTGFNHATVSIVITAFALVRTFGRYAELVVAHNAIFSLLRDLRVRFFQTLAAQPLSSQNETLQSGQKMHRLVSDINALNEFNLRIVLPWLTALVIFSVLAMIFYIADMSLLLFANDLLFYAVVGLLVLCILLPTFMAYRGIKHNRRVSRLAEQRRSELLAPLSIITQLLMWQQWSKQSKAFIESDQQMQALQWQAEKQKSITMLLVQWFTYALIMLLLYAVATAANLDMYTALPFILAMIFALFGLQEVIMPLAQHYMSYGKAKIAKERLNDMLATNASHHLEANLALPKPDDLDDNTIIELKNLSAKMPAAIVGAENISCSVQLGVPMIISGASGCGKSTLLQTLANELLPQSGEILLNGQTWQSYHWADQLGYLGQQLDIFDQTLADNLRLGNADASDDELLAVLDKVALLEWVQAQPQGLQTQLGEYGTAVSGGQARRIALARLLLKPRLVLLLDEPFAGLDKVAQAKLWQTITEHQKSAYLIVVSHHQQWQGIGEVDRLELN